MVAHKQRAKKRLSSRESDSVYFLKLVLYMILGSVWIKFASPIHIGPILLNGLPVGLVIGLLFASRDRYQVDRKIEFALLLMMAIITYFLPAGIVI